MAVQQVLSFEMNPGGRDASLSAAQELEDSVECSASGSNTIRTARSRISGGYRFGLVIAPSSQGLEPPTPRGGLLAQFVPGFDAAAARVGVAARSGRRAVDPEYPEGVRVRNADRRSLGGAPYHSPRGNTDT